MDELLTIPEDRPRQKHYWQAQGLAELAAADFERSLAEDDLHGQRSAFYRLASYYGRTQRILRTAIAGQKDALGQAAMRNLMVLHRPLFNMHRAAPHIVPMTLTMDRVSRDVVVGDLVVRVLSESAQPLETAAIIERVNALDVVGAREGTVRRHLQTLVATGHVARVEGRPLRYQRTGRTYAELDVSAHSFQALVGEELYRQFEAKGYINLDDINARQHVFRQDFVELSGMSTESARLFVQVANTLLDASIKIMSAWPHADLVGSPYPRPYQYEAYAVFRGYGYSGQVIESPTGSGKTMIGMMCVQDWLRTLRPGQSILVLVPTSNYQQQWTGELCYKPIGLRLSPEAVYSGTPAQLERYKKRTGSHPAVMLMTYTSLAQAGSGVGKGGFDIDSIETFLQSANVQYVVLDEVHKVAEDMRSVSSDVTRLMVEWLKDGSLRGLVGFSGTAEAYRKRFGQLGLQLAHSIPIDELIAAGFVAPFAEYGVPFAYSGRERRIRDLLDAYKEAVRNYLELLGADQLRAWFAEIPMEERLAIGHQLLSMYRGRKEWQPVLLKRLQEWERGQGSLKLTELKLVSIVQIAKGWDDWAMMQAADLGESDFDGVYETLDTIRQALITEIYLPRTVDRLSMGEFGRRFDSEGILALLESPLSITARVENTKDGLATSFVGLYDGISDWYRRVGEGRVETIKAVIEAERAARPVSGIIVFDNARRIQWKRGLAIPGYEGVGGLYSQMLGDKRFTPFAVLSSEMYLPFASEDALPPKVATYVEESLMKGEVAQAMFELAMQGLDISDDLKDDLKQRYDELIAAYIPRLFNVRAARPGEFNKRVLAPIRRQMKKLDLGLTGERFNARFSRGNIHLTELIHTFFDYALIAHAFRQPKVGELEQVSGARQKFFVVTMPAGSRKLLMYDLTSRIVDAESLSINLVIVSNWARTGWNVITPNVLVDATATRDVTAWQQLRGRAIRARRTWTNDCYRLMMMLGSSHLAGLESREDLPEDVIQAFEDATAGKLSTQRLDESLLQLVMDVADPVLVERVQSAGLEALSEEESVNLSIELMKARNKVTHIYELVKAYGSTSQIRFDRDTRQWLRKENIAAKHAHEISVNAFSGEKLFGDGHAPLLYADDPRADVPQQLEATIENAISGCDDVIVSGWLERR